MSSERGGRRLFEGRRAVVAAAGFVVLASIAALAAPRPDAHRLEAFVVEQIHRRPFVAPIDPPPPDKLEALRSAEKRFGWELLRALVMPNRGRNVVVSPHAVILALTALGTASTGETREEILKAIGFEGSLEELSDALRYAEERLRQVRTFRSGEDTTQFAPEYSSGVGLWFPDSFPVSTQFAKIVESADRASIQRLGSSWTAGDRANAVRAWQRGVLGANAGPALDKGSPFGSVVVGAALRLDAAWNPPGSTATDFFLTHDLGVHDARYAAYRYPTEWISGLTDSVCKPIGDDIEACFLTIDPGLEPFSPGPFGECDETYEESGSRDTWERSVDPQPGGPARMSVRLAAALENQMDCMFFSVNPEVAKVPVFAVRTELDLRDALREMGITRLFEPGRAELACAGGCGVWPHVRGLVARDYVSAFWHSARLVHSEKGLNDPHENSPRVEIGRVADGSDSSTNRAFFASVWGAHGALLYAAWIADVPVAKTE